MKLLIGALEDNLGFFLRAYIQKVSDLNLQTYINYPFGYDFVTMGGNQPLFTFFIYFLSRYFDSIFVYNSVVLLGIFLTLLTAYLFFKRLFQLKSISAYTAMLFVFSPYFYYHIRSHMDLVQAWILLLFIYSLVFSKTYTNYLVSGLLLGITTLISNYLGFMGFLFLISYTFSSLILGLFTKRSLTKCCDVKKELACFLIVFSSFFLLTFICIFPYIKANYLTATNTVSQEMSIQDSWKLVPSTDKMQAVDSKTVGRSIEELLIFSSKPWYFFLPSVDNPFFGDFSKKAIELLQNHWGYWLTANYFKQEHSSAYLGWATMLFGLIGFFYVIKRYRATNLIQQANSEAWLKVLVLGVTGSIMAILSLPPFITVNLQTIYLPSFLIWKIFPMFRVLVRLDLIVLLISLIFSGFGFIYIKELLAPYGKLLSELVVIVAVFFGLAEFYVPLKFTIIQETPAVYTYVKNNALIGAPLIVFPYNKTVEATYWIREYNRPLINPRQVENKQFGFNSEEFTDRIPSCVGLLEAHNLGASYLLYFYAADKDNKINEAFFKNIPYLTEKIQFIGSYADKQLILNDFVTINYLGNTMSSSVIVYEFNNQFNYEQAQETCLQELKRTSYAHN